MPYITKANWGRVLQRIKLNDFDLSQETVYKSPIFFLGNKEITFLKTMKAILTNAEDYSFELYTPFQREDQLKYVFESNQNSAAYHTNINCPKLNSTFKNIEIPFEIKERATNQAKSKNLNEIETADLVSTSVNDFRAWYSMHYQLFQEDSSAFLKQLDIRWNIQRSPNEIELNNSGNELVQDISLAD